MLGKTNYEVGIKYTLDDKAAKGLTGIGNAAESSSKYIGKLKTALLGIGAGVAGAFYVGKKYLVDYNSEIDQMKIGLTTVIQSQLHKPFAMARKEADGLFLRMQEVAKKSPATTKDFIEMASAIAPAVASLGGGVDKIESLSTGAVIAGQAYGMQADVVGRDVAQMLRGQVTERDQLPKLLLGSIGMDKEKFNQMSGKDRAQLTEKLLNDKSLKDAADQFGDSFQGQLSSLQDQFQITFGEIGKPLVAAITGEFKKWNDWIAKNPELIADFAKKFGAALVDGFNTVKKVVGWIVDNRDTIMMIVKTFAAFKIGQLAGGVIGDVIGNLGKLGSGLGGASSALGLFAGSLAALATYVDEVQTRNLKADTDLITVTEESAKIAKVGRFSDPSYSDLNHLGINARLDGFIDRSGKVNANKLMSMAPLNSDATSEFQAMDLGKNPMTVPEAQKFLHGGGFRGQQSDDNISTSNDERTVFMRQLAALTLSAASTQQDAAKRQQEAAVAQFGNSEMYQKILAGFGFGPLAKTLESGWKNGKGDGNMNVTINKIEVASEDPDRFVFGMNKAFEKAASNRTQAKGAISGGF